MNNSEKSISIENIESSVEHVVKTWQTTQKWHHFINNSNKLDDDGHNNRAPWRTHLANILESNPVHLLAISLLVADLILTILELSSSLLSCKSNGKSINAHKKEEVWYHWAGIAILSLLSTKSAALAVGLGTSFFRHPGYVVDGVVVLGALFLESFLEGKGGGLLAIVSLWRVVRVVESVFELSNEAIEAQIEGIVSQLEALREENTRLAKTIDEKDKVIERLQKEADQCRLQFENGCDAREIEVAKFSRDYSH